MQRFHFLRVLVVFSAWPLAARRASAGDLAEACGSLECKIGQNHGHAFEVSVADVERGQPKTYDLTGTANHPHSLSLDEADFRRLGKGEILRKRCSREGGHAHATLVRCKRPGEVPKEPSPSVAVTIGGKDPHELVLTQAHVDAAQDISFDIQGVADHSHTVTLTAGDFAKLAAGRRVTLKASPTDHTHVVYFVPKKV